MTEQKPRYQGQKKKTYKEHRIPHEKFIHLKFSEYSMHLKYDDLTPPERKILVRMDRGDRLCWQINHFRSIQGFNNDGELIGKALSSLGIKGYIKRAALGFKVKKNKLERDEHGNKKSPPAKWMLV
jgi:hypothetical protein